MSLLENAERFWRILRDGNFSGLWHQFRRVLGLRGPVPAPSMPVPDRRSRADDGFHEKYFFGNSAPRVLVFSHDLNLEGAPLSLFEMILALRQRGIADPELISFKDGPLRMKYQAAGISVSFFPWSSDRLSTVRLLNETVNTLAERIRKKNPDVVFANTLCSFLAILAAKEIKTPSVWNLRESAPWNTFFSYLPDPVAQRAIAAICLPYRVIFVAQASRRVWDRFDQYGNFDVIHTGIDLSRFPERGKTAEKTRDSLNIKDGTVVLLCVGTLSPRKAQRELIEAIALLPKEILKHLQIFFVGEDQNPYAKKLKRRCRALSPDIRERIRFFPSTESVQRFYEAADIFVLCSGEESFPRVILEAMAFGLPIIATPVHGVTEQCVEGENAVFYMKGNIKDLAEKISLLVKEKTLRKQLEQSSMQHFSKLKTFDEMIDDYTSILLQAAKKND